MGGGPLGYKANEELEKTSNDLDNVKFLLYLSEKGNGFLFSNDFFYETLKNEISNYLKKNGIKHEYILAERGGGGLETLKEIFNALWERRQFISFFFSLVRYVTRRYQSNLKENTDKLKPRINIHFFIETNTALEVISKEDVQFMLSNRLANLLLISKSVSDYLCQEHTFLHCDISIAAEISSYNYSVRLTIPEERRNDFNINRLLKIIKVLTIKKFLSCDYSFTKWHLIRRLDTITSNTNELSSIKSTKNYLFLSSRLLSDYAK